MDALTPPLALPRWGERIEAALGRVHAPLRWPHLLVALLLAAPVPLAMALMPALLVNYTHHDIFIPLDAAWRTLNGQWPHSDYYTPLGLSYVALHGAAASLGGMNGRVLVRADLIALPFVLGPGLLLAWRRLGAVFTVLLALLLSVLVTAPVFLDGPERLIAHLANYNRIGGGLCAVVALWALCPPRYPSRALDLAEAVLLAVVFLVLLYLKVTFFALAGVTALAGCGTVPGLWRRAAGVGALGLVGMGALEALHPGLLLSYLADIRRAGAANTILFRGFYTPQALLTNLLPCALIALLGAMAVRISRPQLRGTLGILAVAFFCVLVATQNFGAFSAPLVVLMMLTAQRLVAAAAGPGGYGAAPLLGMAGLAAVLLAVTPFLETQLAGTVYQVTLLHKLGTRLGEGRSPALRDVVWLDNPVERAFMPPDFTLAEARRWDAVLPITLAGAVLDDGLDLLNRTGLQHRRIAALSFSNPFPVALGAPPPRGVALWWDEDRTFTASRLTPAQALGDADVVMVPKLWWHLQLVAALLQVAQPTLQQGFTPHESRYWTAWERNPPPS